MPPQSHYQSKERQKLMQVGHIIAIKDGNHVRTVELAGTHNMFQKVVELLNNSETVMMLKEWGCMWMWEGIDIIIVATVQ